MLVLTRKQSEKIRIGPSITITVLRMKGKAVRLGIDAPQDISVIRGELCFDLDDDEVEEQPSRSQGKSRGTRSDISSEVTQHWPLESSGEPELAAVGCSASDTRSPLRAMLKARQR